MAPPAHIAQWLKRTYPKPQVDPDWLEGCYSWIEEEHHLDPTTQMDEIIHHVDLQLLQSDLTDSMLAGTGFPPNIAALPDTTIRGPVLVQIISIAEVGHSAFTLQNVRQARLEREDMAVTAQPLSKLWNIAASQSSFSGRRPSVLRVTKPQTLKHCKTVTSHEVSGYVWGLYFCHWGEVIAKDSNFSKPDDPAQEEPEPRREYAPAHALQQHAPAARANAAPPSTRQPQAPAASTRSPIRSPLNELSEPPAPPIAGPSGTHHDDDEGQPRRRKVPSRTQRSPSPDPPPRTMRSQYFVSGSDSGTGSRSHTHNPSADIARERLFSPHRQPPVVVPDSDEEDLFAGAPTNAVGKVGPSRKAGDTDNSSPRMPSSDFDFAFNWDDAFQEKEFIEQVERLENAERAKRGGTPQPTVTTSSSATIVELTQGRPSAAVTQRFTTSSNAHASSSSSGDRARSTTLGMGSGPAPSADRRTVDMGIIDIDDSDEDDKENAHGEVGPT
ncbi:predicted protein [Postia placenta Mad-698-R]|nr:predicted protein [Postia placenta Mad-698-R]